MLIEQGGRFYHIYKGIEIEKIEKHYAQGNEICYRIGKEYFDKLKDAKHYINVTLVTTDYTAVGGKKELNNYQKPFGYW